MLSHEFQYSSAHVSPLGVWYAEAQLTLLAPDLAALPERHPTTTGRATFRSKGEMADLYKQHVARASARSSQGGLRGGLGSG